MTESKVKAVSRAICRAQGTCKYIGGKCNTSRCSVAPDVARAAIAAMKPATKEMVTAGCLDMSKPLRGIPDLWATMIDTALGASHD